MKILLACLLILFLLASSCSRRAAIAPSAEELEAAGFRPIPDSPSVPEIVITEGNGTAHVLSDYQGSVVLLTFWASWCPPCRAEIPSLNRLVHELKENEFVMLAINAGEKPEFVADFIDEYKVEYPVYFDENLEAVQTLGIESLPTSILLDRKGRGIAVITGAVEWDSNEILSLLERLSRK